MAARFLTILIFKSILMSIVLLLPVRAEETAVRFAVHPFLPPSELMDRFTPLMDYLSGEINRPIEIVVSKDYADHIHVLGNDEADFAYIGPAGYVKLSARYGVKPLLGRIMTYGNPAFHGVIIVRKDSDIVMMNDLAGKRFAFGDPNSTMSHLVPRYIMWENGITLDSLRNHVFLMNHNNVALGVLSGDFDAGAVKNEIFDEYERRGLRALMYTPAISEHLFVAGNKSDPYLIKKLGSVLLRLSESDQGLKALSKVKHSIDGIAPVQDSDYDNLRVILSELEKQGVAQ
jgi:phosphonate transport system substrate-binding protein